MNELTSLDNLLLCALLCTLATFIPRVIPVFLAGKEPPKLLEAWLGYVPAAVMAALVAPDIFFYGGSFNPFPLDNLFLVAGIASVAFCLVTKNFFGTILFAMGFVALVRYLGLMA